MKRKNIITWGLILLAIAIAILSLILASMLSKNNQLSLRGYNPKINPNEFVAGVQNKYFALAPGTKYTYTGKTEEGIERIEVYVTNATKKVMGVTTMVVLDRVWLDNELIEETYDWYAQDKYGNVWYFGEESKEFADGKVASTKGSWEAGVNGAKPGIMMKANPKAGDAYRQEYYKGEAEDMAEVIALGLQVKVKAGSFYGCLQTREWTPLDPDAEEYKYYCPEAGNLVYEVGAGSEEGNQLVEVKMDLPAEEKEQPEELKKELTEDDAIKIAKKTIEGKVTDVGIEKKYGKLAYVVEIGVDGEETDVIVDIETGNVLGIER